MHILKYEDISKLEGLGLIEYKLPIKIYNYVQPSIEIKGSIDMVIINLLFQINFLSEQTKYIILSLLLFFIL